GRGSAGGTAFGAREAGRVDAAGDGARRQFAGRRRSGEGAGARGGGEEPDGMKEVVMAGVLALSLPILLSAVLVFVVSSVIHMASPWHKGDYPKLSNED